MSGSNGEFVIDGNMKSVEYAEKLRNVHVPTPVIAREHDAWSLAMSHEMNDRIAGSRLAILPQSKHMTFVDQTEMFNRAVDEFVYPHRSAVGGRGPGPGAKLAGVAQSVFPSGDSPRTMRSEAVVSERRACGLVKGTSGDMLVSAAKGRRSAFAGAVARAGGDPANRSNGPLISHSFVLNMASRFQLRAAQTPPLHQPADSMRYSLLARRAFFSERETVSYSLV